MRISKNRISLAPILFAISSIASADIEEYKTLCTEDEMKVIKESVENSRSEVSKVMILLDSGDSLTIEKFVRWFGSVSSESSKEILDVLSKIHLFSGFQNSWCIRPVSKPVPDDFNWAPGDLAGVHPDSTSDIFYAPDYFTLEKTGIDSMSSTVTHENAHQVGVNYQPEVYKISEVEQLAIDSDVSARSHAQSIEYFVTDTLYGI